VAQQSEKLFSSAPFAVVTPQTSGSRPRTLTPSQILFSSRLARLLRLKEEWTGRVPANDGRLRMIHKAIYSTYCDCVEAGIADDARALVNPKSQ